MAHPWSGPKGTAAFAEMKRLRADGTRFTFADFQAAWEAGHYCLTCGADAGEPGACALHSPSRESK